MDLKHHPLTPALFCVLVDTLPQTGSLGDHPLVVDSTLVYLGNHYSHFGPGTYRINSNWCNVQQLMEHFDGIKQEGRNLMKWGEHKIWVNGGVMQGGLLGKEGGVEKLEDSAIRWFRRDDFANISALKKAYQEVLSQKRKGKKL